MSHLFIGYFYDKRRFSARYITEFWTGIEPCLAGEKLVQIAVSPRVEAVFYMGSASLGKAMMFGFGCEAFIRDGYTHGPARKLLEAGNDDFQYAAWTASELSDYDVSMCFTGHAFEGRAMGRGQAERVSTENGMLKYHEIGKLQLNPQELGMVVDGSVPFDEEEYQRRLTEKEEPFRPGLLVHDEIGVTRGKVMDALSNAYGGSGTTLWPEGSSVDTPDTKRASLGMIDPQVPNLPLWTHLMNEPGGATSGRPITPRRRRKS